MPQDLARGHCLIPSASFPSFPLAYRIEAHWHDARHMEESEPLKPKAKKQGSNETAPRVSFLRRVSGPGGTVGALLDSIVAAGDFPAAGRQGGITGVSPPPFFFRWEKGFP